MLKAVLPMARLCAETVTRIHSCAPSNSSVRPTFAGIHTCFVVRKLTLRWVTVTQIVNGGFGILNVMSCPQSLSF